MVKECNRVIFVFAQKTSMCMDRAEWNALDCICQTENIRRDSLLELIETHKDKNSGLTSSVRVFSISYHYHATIMHLKEQKDNIIISPLSEAIKDIL